MSWIGALLISSCITVTFIKRWNMLLHTKLNNSQMYFRDTPIDTMIYKTSAYHFMSCIAAREQCQLY